MDADDWPLARRGDADAFERIYRRHHNSVYNFVASRTDDLTAAEDVCAETFTALWKQRDAVELHAEGGLLPWLYTVARRAVTRAATPTHASIDQIAEDPYPSDPVGEQIAMRDFFNRAKSEIAALPEDYRAVALAVFRDGLNSTQAGTALGIPPATVRTRLRWLRATLTARLSMNDEKPAEVNHD